MPTRNDQDGSNENATEGSALSSFERTGADINRSTHHQGREVSSTLSTTRASESEVASEEDAGTAAATTVPAVVSVTARQVPGAFASGPISPPASLAAGGAKQSLSKGDITLAVIAVVVMLLASAGAYGLKKFGWSNQDAFNFNAVGLIVGQGIAGPIRFSNRFWWPVLSTLASLLLLVMTYFL